MFVEKRDGSHQLVDFNKISSRIQYLADGTDPQGICVGAALNIDYIEIAKGVCGSLVNNIKTNELDELAGEMCAYRIGEHPDYGVLASRIIISNHHKNTVPLFSEVTKLLHQNIDEQGKPSPTVTADYHQFVVDNAEYLDNLIIHNNDYNVLNYFGFKTLYKSYLLKYKTQFPSHSPSHSQSSMGNKSGYGMERYQHLLMRQAVYINFKTSSAQTVLDDIKKCYTGLTNGLYTHATPTILNSGKSNAQLSSCFLLGMYDSVDGMYNCVRNCSHISKGAGGIGIHLHDIRSNGSKIRGTGGKSDGITPLAKTINSLAVHINQGGARPGAIALYLEPWHADIIDFLELRLPSGLDARRTRDIFTSLWIPDLFMKRVKQALDNTGVVVLWSLMCPDQSPNLANVYGTEFEQLYEKYEQEHKFVRQIDILRIWNAILTSQRESGTPYMCYKDHVNRKSAQSNLGTIRSSNLCAEIVEFSNHNEYATCNLGSINLKKMLSTTTTPETGIEYIIDHQLLYQTAYQLACNLNNVIDINHYPVFETSRSNFRHRPIGMGVTGLADVFMIMQIAFDSPQARTINRDIFETIYYGALSASNDLARIRCQQLSAVPVNILQTLKQYVSLIEYYDEYLHDINIRAVLPEMMSVGQLSIYQANVAARSNALEIVNGIIGKYNLPKLTYEYGYMPLPEKADQHTSAYYGAYSSFVGSPASKQQLQYHLWGVEPSGRWDFAGLLNEIRQWGLRNSLTTAVMPTATTAQILGNVECIEPITSNFYVRQTLAGTFMIANQYLQEELIRRGIWTIDIKNKIIAGRGSIQKIAEIPADLKLIYRTVWEISKKSIIEMSADRGAFIDQSQSLNIYTDTPSDKMIQSIHLYSWEKGLKTGMYYLRTRPVVNADQFTLAQTPTPTPTQKNQSHPQPQPQSDVMSSGPVCTRDNPNCTSCSA